MFTIKNAIMEILNKSKSLDEVLETLNKEDQIILLDTFDLMKAKLGGSIDIMDTQNNGQWSLAKNTLDYSKFNKPKTSDEPVRTIDYSSPEMKAANVKAKPWAGAVARRDAALADYQKQKDNKIESPKSQDATGDKSALESIKDRNTTKKSEDASERIKNEFKGEQPKTDNEIVAEAKKRFVGKQPKTDNEIANEAKIKYRNESKSKADEPFNNNIIASKKQHQRQS